MDVDTEAVGFVILPLALVDIAISVPEFTRSVGLVLAPFSLILCTIGPDLDTRSVSHAILQIAYW